MMIEILEVEKRIEFVGFYHRVLMRVVLLDGLVVDVRIEEHYRVILL